MRFLLSLAWRDLRASGRQLWIFAACLVLGVSLVAAGGGLYTQVADALRADARVLFGGDVEIESTQPLSPDVLSWMQQPDHGGARISRMIEMRTMMLTPSGSARLIELQSADDAYPLYGEVTLEPSGSLDTTLTQRDGAWGAVLDATLAERLSLGVGDSVSIGELTLVIRALIMRQPDRSLRANWRGAPVLISENALKASGLLVPGSRVEYLYRVRTDASAQDWRDQFIAAFPDLSVEVDTFDERSERIADVLAQIGSGLLLIGVSALFIGGLGVFNSVHAYLQGKLTSLATLRSLGLRDARLAIMVLLQIVMLAIAASLIGVLIGNLLALAGASVTATQLPVSVLVGRLWWPSVVALLFGVLTAVTFALPALGRALSVTPAALFRGVNGAALRTPARAWAYTGIASALVLALLLLTLPDRRFALAFVLVTVLVLVVLELVTRGLRKLARRWQNGPRATGPLSIPLPLPLPLQLALANLQQPASPLRAALLSLGSALTLLVACTLVVTTLVRTINDTVPANAPALVFYDIQTDQIPVLNDTLSQSPGLQQVRTAPFVLGRLASVNGSALRDSDDGERVREARDEHKLSNRSGNFDDVVIDRGAWWPENYQGEPLVAMEDREADQMGLQVGDQLQFVILGETVQARLVAIYSQRRMQARLWLEAIFSDGVLEPFITRHVGAAYLPAGETLAAQDRLAAVAPNIATIRTESLLQETRGLMGKASSALAVVALVCLVASLLVLGSVVAASRSRQIYDSTVMHALGARHSLLKRALLCEYALLAAITAVFAILAGSLLATALLRWRLEMDPSGLYWSGALMALLVSVISLGLGARYLLRQMRLNPAMLLRTGG
jgi:putative ABC transport system permease protein